MPDRSRLAEQQAKLVRALLGAGDFPAGFDPERLQASADSLRRKRARELARRFPGLAFELGGALAPSLDMTLPGTTASALALGRARLCEGTLGDPAYLELLALELRAGKRFVRLALRRGPLRLALALRLPKAGERWLLIGRWRRTPPAPRSSEVDGG